MSRISPVLRVDCVSKSYASPSGPVEVLRDVSLCVDEGSFTIVTGPSGSGKTTFLNLAALLDGPTAGRMVFDGEDTARLDEDALAQVRGEKIGMVFQQFCLLPHRTVLENVLFRFRYVKHDPAETRRRAGELLESFGLGDRARQRAKLLSSGEMQRVAIARAVALRPRLLIADEPTGNLDRGAARGVMDCFARLNGEGITVVMATHNEGLLAYGSRHLVCADGRIAPAADGAGPGREACA